MNRKTQIINALLNLTAFQLETAIDMIEYCLNNHKCLGMDEGYTKTGKPTLERRQLQKVVDSCLYNTQ